MIFQLSRHVTRKVSVEENLAFKNCGERFGQKWKLMKHRKLKHIDTVAPCRIEIAGACTFTDEMCWWTHGKSQNGQNYKNEFTDGIVKIMLGFFVE